MASGVQIERGNVKGSASIMSVIMLIHQSLSSSGIGSSQLRSRMINFLSLILNLMTNVATRPYGSYN